MPTELAITLANIEEKMTDVLDVLVGSAENGIISSEAMFDMCTQLRRLAIGSLLLDMDLDGFVSHLFRSARCYVCLLEAAQPTPDIDRYYLCLGRAFPLLDAIAIGDDDAIGSIAQLAGKDWIPDYEEEDDYCYFRFLLEYLQDGDGLESHLDRFEACVGDAPTHRYDVCRALFEKDQGSYWEAVYSYLDEKAEQELEALQTTHVEPEYAATESHLSVEGVALVRQGRAAGFQAAEADFPLVPSFVLQADLAKFPQTDPWSEVRERLMDRKLQKN